MTSLVDLAYERSLDLLRRAGTPDGFVASPSFDHYAVIWGRDGLISVLGALRSGEPDLVEASAATLDTLSRHASGLGQIPAVVAPAKGEWDFAEGGAVDTTAWFPIAAAAYVAATGDRTAARRWWPAVEAAVRWLRHQDVTCSGLVSAAPSTDWMDAALTRSGRTLHLNVLAAAAEDGAATLAATLGESFPTRDLGATVDAWFWPVAGLDLASLYPHGFAHHATRIGYWEAASPNRRHYLSHIVHAAFIDRCDVLANLLAIRFRVADSEKAAVVLDHLADCADPYPTKTFPEPIAPMDGTGMLISVAEASIPERWRNRPGAYHNGAAWPYIGGFHVEALSTRGRDEEAKTMLTQLAVANSLGDWSFPEWIDAEGNPAGASLQTWNAATFVLAYRAVSSS